MKYGYEPDHPVYWRIHWRDAPPFNARNAKSIAWGAWGEGEPTEGYSCAESLFGLVEYFEFRGGFPHESIVVFQGRVAGHGDDGEPLVVPTRIVCWVPCKHWKEAVNVAALDDEEAERKFISQFGQLRSTRCREPHHQPHDDVFIKEQWRR